MLFWFGEAWMSLAMEMAIGLVKLLTRLGRRCQLRERLAYFEAVAPRRGIQRAGRAVDLKPLEERSQDEQRELGKHILILPSCSVDTHEQGVARLADGVQVMLDVLVAG